MCSDERESMGKKEIPKKKKRLPKRCPSLHNVRDSSSVVEKVRLNSKFGVKNFARLPLKRTVSGNDLGVSCPESWGALRIAIAEIARKNNIS